MTARERILAALAALGPDDSRSSPVAEGLRLGRAVYGELDLAHDARDMGREALEEVRDALIYSAAALVRQARAGAAR